MLILRPREIQAREIQALRSQNYDTEMLPLVHRNAVKGVDNAIPCHRTAYDRNKRAQVALP